MFKYLAGSLYIYVEIFRDYFSGKFDLYSTIPLFAFAFCIAFAILGWIIYS
jgi:hypothetical protein